MNGLKLRKESNNKEYDVVAIKAEVGNVSFGGDCYNVELKINIVYKE